MSEWKECKLGDIATLNYGKALKENVRICGNIPVFSSAGISGWHNSALVDSKGIIIGRKGTIGKVYKTEVPFFCIDTAYYVLPNENIYDFTYIYYALQNLGLEELNSDSAVPGLNREAAYNQELLLPPLPEQKAIASVLSSLDNKIDLLNRQNKTLESMAEALFRQWFVVEAEEGWEEVALNNLLSIKHGFAFKGSDISDEITNNILVTPGNFKIGGGFKDDKFKYYIGQNIPNDYTFSPYDLVVTMTDLSVDTDTLGYPAYIPFYKGVNFLHNQRVGKIIFKQNCEIYKNFIYFTLKTDEYRAYILGTASGTSIMHTSPDRITSFKLNIPPRKSISQFNVHSDSYFQKISKNVTEIRTLEKLRDTLLPKLMSGEVQVKV